MLTVALAADEWRKVIELGESRQQNHRPTDRDALRLYEDENREHVMGATAEFSFEILTEGRCPMDRTLKRSGDGGQDGIVHMHNGKSFAVAIKARSGDYDLMLVKTKDAGKAALYVHANVKRNVVTFWGGIKDKQLADWPQREARNPRLARAGVYNYEIPRDKLPYSMDVILAGIKEWGVQ